MWRKRWIERKVEEEVDEVVRGEGRKRTMLEESTRLKRGGGGRVRRGRGGESG